ncbi:MAG: inositol monophosphatase family protein [Capsulimonadaceae bacterium]
MDAEQIVLSLTAYIRDSVRPHLGQLRSRNISGTASSGDATFAIDDVAEEAVVSFIKQYDLSIAYYSEDKGLVELGRQPEGVLIIDPIDGTRPAAAGFESCVVSVAWADYSPNCTMGDVRYGCLQEIKGDAAFFAERGKGARWIQGGVPQAARLLDVEEIARCPLSFEAVARPLEWLGPALSDIVNQASVKGGCFLFNSTAYSLSRLVTGQLGGVLDVGNRIFRDYPAARNRFLEVGFGKPLGLFTYDIAAAALIASEAGAVVTDAYGRSFDTVPLLDTSEQNLTSIIAASTPVLHARLLDCVNAGVSRLAIG